MFYKLLFDQNGIFFDPQEKGKIICKKIERQAPSYEVNYETFEGMNGSRETTASFRPFEIKMELDIFYKDEFEKTLILTDLYQKIFPGFSYYITYELEPGKRYFVNPTDLSVSEEGNGYSQVSISYTVISGCSESLGKTVTDFSLSEEWQFEQGIDVEEDYKYIFETSAFVVYNGGDFVIDPREHDLKISIEAISDSSFTIFNKTTGDRFTYYPEMDRNLGHKLTIEGVYPKINGVSCGIDTNHGLITLAPGPNLIEIQNSLDTHSEWDFRFLYK